MKQEYDDWLCKEFPKLYKDRYASMQTTCMCWGFAIGDGWFPLIKGLSYAIQNHIDYREKEIVEAKEWNAMVARGEKPAWWRDVADPKKKKIPKAVRQVVVSQVKEKFGTLRFYVGGGDEITDAYITLAETISAFTSEDCGAPAESQCGMGWIRVLCPQCHDGFLAARKDQLKEYEDEK